MKPIRVEDTAYKCRNFSVLPSNGFLFFVPVESSTSDYGHPYIRVLEWGTFQFGSKTCANAAHNNHPITQVSSSDRKIWRVTWILSFKLVEQGYRPIVCLLHAGKEIYIGTVFNGSIMNNKK